MSVSSDIARHQEWLGQHEQRIMSLEISRAKQLGAYFVLGALGSIAGSILVVIVTKALHL